MALSSMYEKTIVENSIKEYGIKGQYLRDLLCVVGSLDELEAFQNYIILNDGKFKSSIGLVAEYLKYMRKNHSYQTSEEFINDYKISKKREIIIGKLFMSHIDNHTMNKIRILLENGVLSLTVFFNHVVEYRSQYTSNLVINLLELDIKTDKARIVS